MRMIPLLLTLVLCAGCTTLEITTFDPATGKPITVEAEASQRSCLAATINPATGVIDVIVGQDASSDYAGIRAIPVLGALILSMISQTAVPADYVGPSDIGGCDTIFAE